jgi:hypothetical protein
VTDAAQRTATLFEKLPAAGAYSDSVLKSIAVLLRWDYTGGSRHPSSVDAAQALRAVIEHWGYLERYAAAESMESVTSQLSSTNDSLRAVVKRLEARYLPPERPKLTLVQGSADDA